MKDQKNTFEQKQLLLHHLIQIVQELHPNTRTQNPYQTATIADYLDLQGQLLFRKVLHCITVINGHSRTNDTREIISTRSDYINALQLVLPAEMKLDVKSLNAHAKLRTHFVDNPFTQLEACCLLRISKTGFRRRLQPLLLQSLIIKQKEKREQKALFRAIEPDLIDEKQNPTQSLFEMMQGEWKDYIGFVEF
jgi:hypothetical protein